MHARPHARWPWIALALSLEACARHPPVVLDPRLPLRHVVVYRNGIGYFERAGHVAGDEVRFRVQQSEVGDFLSTLTVMEQGGSSVRSAAFPMPESAPTDGPPSATSQRSVRLSLDGRGHDLTVGYTVETPIWRPSYRLVFDANDHARIQAWGIVQNLSGEDWSNVSLSLVAGSPVSFRSELATAMIPPRPEVTDRGAVIDAVPLGETTLAQGEAPQPVVPPTGSTVYEQPATQPDVVSANSVTTESGQVFYRGGRNGPAGGGHAARERMAEASRRPTRTSPVSGAGTAVATPPPPPEPPTSAPRNLAALAALAAQGGTTRYNLPTPVTIPDRSATMVMLISDEIPGSQTYLFAPDPGVADSSSHPFHIARFVNRTGALLERGPLAIFERGAFLGEGLLEPLPDGASASVPFALERGVSVDSSQTGAIEGARLIRVLHDAVTIERYQVTRTTYRVRNGLDHGVQVMLRQGLPEGVTLFDPPSGTEHSNGASLVPLHVDGQSHGEVVVVARRPFNQQEDWTGEEAAEAIRAYLHGTPPSDAVTAALRTALDLRTQLVDAARRREGIAQRQQDIVQNTDETRENLYAIRTNARAADLRAQLTARLATLARENDQITRQLVELDTNIGERRVRLAETVRAIDFDTTAPPHPAAPTPAAHP